MIKIKSLKLLNVEDAIYGMRLPLMSHDKSDSKNINGQYVIGKNDLKLMKMLYKAGTDHRKYTRQIMVSMILIAPMYWELERDTYKISKTKNSSSKMHKIMSKKLTIEDFSLEDIETESEKLIVKQLLDIINSLIDYYKICNYKDKERTFRKVIQLLPESFNYETVWTGSLENLINMYHSRKNHKLLEWREWCKYLEKETIFKNIVLD